MAFTKDTSSPLLLPLPLDLRRLLRQSPRDRVSGRAPGRRRVLCLAPRQRRGLGCRQLALGRLAGPHKQAPHGEWPGICGPIFFLRLLQPLGLVGQAVESGSSTSSESETLCNVYGTMQRRQQHGSQGREWSPRRGVGKRGRGALLHTVLARQCLSLSGRLSLANRSAPSSAWRRHLLW